MQHPNALAMLDSGITDNGVAYLRAHGVEVENVEGPPDPRAVA